ncbi:MAG: efflux RND transporter permease subunit [Candidatus Marinimicrobia bacterium]|nr:efflux RND transporter permease subunit [Candidatus Neomarinimicrobiota bacterium]
MQKEKFSIPRFSIEHPHFTIVLTLLLLVLGIVSFLSMPARMAPKIPAKNLGVMCMYPGLPAEDMSKLIAQPLEKKLQIVGDVEYTTGVSQEGWCMVVFYFKEGVNLDAKKTELKNLADVVAAMDLPKLMGKPLTLRVVRVDKQNVPVVQFAITRESVSRKDLREFINNLVVSRFQKIPNVQAVGTFGGPVREIQVSVDRNKLEARNLSIRQVKMAIDKSRVIMAGGPLLNNTTEELASVFLSNEINVENVLRELPDVVLASQKGRNIYLRDVAAVKDTVQEMYGDFFYNGKPAIWLGIQPMAEADFYEIDEKAIEFAALLENEYPGLKIEKAFSKTRLMRLNDKNAIIEFFLAASLAGFVILLLLGELGGTMIALAIIPSSVAFGFFVLDMMGFQRDFGIVMGLVFIVGKLVDDSVVVMEVIRRYIDKGIHPRIAAIIGTEEVMPAITLATLTFVVVLFPMTQLSGDMGSGFRSMTTPMIVTILASLVLSVTLTPLMAAHYMRIPKDAVTDEEKARSLPITEELGVFMELEGWLGTLLTRFFLRPFFRMEKVFGRLATWSLDHTLIVMAFMGASLWITMGIFKSLDEEQMPLTDTSIAIGYVRVDPNVTPERMFEISREISAIVKEEKNVIDISMMTGKAPMWGQFFSGYEINNHNEAMIIMNFTIARQEREETMWDINDRIRKKAYQTIPELDAFLLQPVPPTPVAGARAPVEIFVRGFDKDLVYGHSQKMLYIARTQAEGLHSPYIDQTYGLQKWRLKVDEPKAAQMGLNVADVISQTMMSLYGVKSNWFFQPYPEVYEHSKLLIRYSNPYREDVNDLSSIIIKTPKGKSVPLSAIAKIKRVTGYDRLHTFNTLYAASLLGYYKELGLKATTMSALMPAKMQLAQPKGVQLNPAGMMITMLDAFNTLNKGLKIGLIAVYLLLVVYFRSFAIGVVLMLAIPLGGLGSIFSLWFRGMAWSPPVLWGLVILGGIVLSNSILMVDKIEELRKAGWSIRKAIPFASAVRLRPVLMTAITTGIAMMPMALYPPPATEQFRNIATAITGGLASSTIMTLIVIPVAYFLMHGFIVWLKRFYTEQDLNVMRETVD